MARLYHRREWKEFRAQIIEHDGGKCQICGRGVEDGIVLQVHHKIYRKNVLPWDYDPHQCQTLCMAHHAEFHEKIRPSSGWDFLYEEDLGDLAGTCEVCGTEIRYVFYIDHPKWESLAVGTHCCDRLTGTKTASELRLKSERKDRFLQSDGWSDVSNGTLLTRMKMEFLISKDDEGYFIHFLKRNGIKRFLTLGDAKEGLFDFIDSGDAKRYRRKKQSEIAKDNL